MVRIVDPAYAARVRAQAETHLTMWRTEDLVDPCLARTPHPTPWLCTLPLLHTPPHRDQWAAKVWWNQ